MWKLVSTLLLTFVLACQGQSLEGINERFANLSQQIQPEIHNFTRQNEHVRLQLIRWIVREIGNLTVDMRNITEHARTAMETHELLHDGCRQYVQDQFDYYVHIGALDIMYCAYDMDYYMRFDDTYRFVPRVRFMNRENFQALSWTVCTLGSTSLMDGVDKVVSKLKEDVQQFEELWDEYRKVLAEEIKDIASLVSVVHSEMNWWYTFAIYWHRLLMRDVINFLELVCKYH